MAKFETNCRRKLSEIILSLKECSILIHVVKSVADNSAQDFY